MEGDKKRKRAASDSAHPRSGGPLSIHNSESSHILAADAAPAGLSGPGIEEKTKHAGGRPPGHGQPMTNQGSHLVNNRKNQRASSARSADQVRQVVSLALDSPRTPVSSSATLFICVPDPQAIASNSADPPRPSTRAPAGAASTKPVRQADRTHGPSREAHLRAHSPLRARSCSAACSCTQCQRSHPSPSACSN